MHGIDESRPFFTDAEPNPAQARIIRQLQTVAPGGPENQLAWIAAQLAEVGQVSAEDLLDKVLRSTMDKHWHRAKIRVRAHERKRS